MHILEREISQAVIDSLNLEDLTVDDIDPVAPLFGTGLGLDSIDALELGIMLSKRYGIKIDADGEHTRQHFASIRNLAAFVAATRHTPAP